VLSILRNNFVAMVHHFLFKHRAYAYTLSFHVTLIKFHIPLTGLKDCVCIPQFIICVHFEKEAHGYEINIGVAIANLLMGLNSSLLLTVATSTRKEINHLYNHVTAATTMQCVNNPHSED